MILYTPNYVLRALSTGDDAPEPIFADYIQKWARDNETVELDTRQLTDKQLKSIIDFVNRDTYDPPIDDDLQKKFKDLRLKYDRFCKLMAQGKQLKIKALTNVPTAFESYCKTLTHGRFYEYDKSDNIVGWLATNCKYYPAYKDSPAHAQFSFDAILNGETVSKSFSVYVKDIGDGVTMSQIIDDNKLFAETEELNNEYERHQQLMTDMVNDIGGVYTGVGVAEKSDANSNGYSSWFNKTKFHFNESSNKVVSDHLGQKIEEDSNNSNAKSNLMYRSMYSDHVPAPVHTYVNVFHLDQHCWLTCHVSQLTKYKFQGSELINKLVLPADHKTLINILVHQSKMHIEDIVSGKTGGSFIMCTGDPGTGKTLTAEVVAESIEKSLYKVQCSQLGLNINDVEKNLQRVLNRASRWGSILLIDEADVYVRARGEDIEQNAIVGVFLRTLEYYTGILMMTSNLGTSIDDAIMSRATAHLIYQKPGIKDLEQLWSILSKQFEIILTADDIDRLVNRFNSIVGRDVKALLKLAKMYSIDQKTEITVESIITVAAFVPNVNKIQQSKLYDKDSYDENVNEKLFEKWKNSSIRSSHITEI